MQKIKCSPSACSVSVTLQVSLGSSWPSIEGLGTVAAEKTPMNLHHFITV